MKAQMGYLSGLEKMDSPKSVYLSDDQASCSSQTNSMSAPASPHPEVFSSSINILKAVLTGSQEVSKYMYIFSRFLQLHYLQCSCFEYSIFLNFVFRFNLSTGFMIEKLRKKSMRSA